MEGWGMGEDSNETSEYARARVDSARECGCEWAGESV